MQYYVNDCPSSPQSSRLPLPTRIGSYLPISIAQRHLTSKQGSLQQPQRKQISYVYYIYIYMFKKRVCSMTSSPCRISGPSAPQGAQESSVDLPPRRCARRSAHTSCPRQRCCTSARDIPPSYTDHASLMTGVMLGIYWVRSC